MCEYHMSQVPIEALLHGRNLGHNMRWADEFARKHAATHSPFVKTLETHLEVAKSAKALSSGVIRRMDQAEFDMHVGKLDESGDAMPTAMKTAILDRSVEKYIENNMQAELLHALVPSEKEQPECFIPSKPMLCRIEGCPMEKAMHFRSHIIGWFVTLVRRGKDSADRLVAAAEFVVKFLEEHELAPDDEDEAAMGEDPTDAAVEVVTGTAGALLLLVAMRTKNITADLLNNGDSLDNILAARSLKGVAAATNPWTALSSAVEKSTDFYQDKAAVWKAHAGAMRRHIPRVQPAIKTLDELHFITDEGEIPAAVEETIMTILVPAVSELPVGAVQNFEDYMEKQATTIIEGAMVVCKAGGTVARPGWLPFMVDPVKLGHSLAKFIKTVETAMSTLRPICDKAMQDLHDLEVECRGSQMSEKLVKALATVIEAEETPVPDESLAAVQTAAHEACDTMGDAIKAMAPAHPDIEKALPNLWATCAHSKEHLAKWLPTTRMVISLLPMARQTTNELCDKLGVFDAANTMCEKRSAWLELGASDAERWTADRGQRLVRAWRASVITMDEARAKVEGDPIELFEVMAKECAEAFSEISTVVADVSSATAQAVAEELKTMLDEAEWPCAADYADVDWDAFMTAAEAKWLSYPHGDKLRAKGDELRWLLDTWNAVRHIFEGTKIKLGGDGLEAFTETTLKVDALVWCVKTIKAIERNLESPTKLKRYCKSRLAALQGDDGAGIRTMVPGTLLAKLESGGKK